MRTSLLLFGQALSASPPPRLVQGIYFVGSMNGSLIHVGNSYDPIHIWENEKGRLR